MPAVDVFGGGGSPEELGISRSQRLSSSYMVQKINRNFKVDWVHLHISCPNLWVGEPIVQLNDDIFISNISKVFVSA